MILDIRPKMLCVFTCSISTTQAVGEQADPREMHASPSDPNRTPPPPNRTPTQQHLGAEVVELDVRSLLVLG